MSLCMLWFYSNQLLFAIQYSIYDAWQVKLVYIFDLRVYQDNSHLQEICFLIS